MSDSNRFLVKAGKDGRGHFRPFGTYTGKQEGARVSMGNNDFRVGKDGRVTIPKRYMNFGETGDDGNKRIVVEFASQPGSEGWQKVGCTIIKPPESQINGKTGDGIHYDDYDYDNVEDGYYDDWLEPYDSGDYNWSV